MARTKGIESFWSLRNRGYSGTHHQRSAKHLGQYLNEFATGHNIRKRSDTIAQMNYVIDNMEGCRLKYADLIDQN